MPLDELGGCLGSLIELVADISDAAFFEFIWWWFGVTGSVLVFLVTFGQVWLMEDRPHLAGFIGLALHIAVIVWCSRG